jgi:hypothetical protein
MPGEAIYPRVYRVEPAARHVFQAFGYGASVLVVGGRILVTAPRRDPMMDLFGVAAVALFLLIAIVTGKRRAVLREDGIESIWWFRPRYLALDQIAGRRMGYLRMRAGEVTYYILIAKDGRELKLPPLLRYDRPFHDWMNRFPLTQPPRTGH